MKHCLFGAFLVVFVYSCYGATPFKSCYTKGKVSSVVIPGCNAPPCQLKKGAKAEISVTFTPDKADTVAKANVHGIISGLPVPFTPPDVDGCHGCGLTCPLVANKQYTYNNTIDIKKSYPSLNLIVKWELEDENNNDIFCIEVPVSIVS